MDRRKLNPRKNSNPSSTLRTSDCSWSFLSDPVRTPSLQVGSGIGVPESILLSQVREFRFPHEQEELKNYFVSKIDVAFFW